MIYIYNEFLKPPSLVVCLVDDLTEGIPVGAIKLKIKKAMYELSVKPVRNASAYYIYKNLNAGEYMLVINSLYYVPFSYDIVITKSDSNDTQIHTITSCMIPGSRYPFGSGTTLVRGIVKGEIPSDGVEVTARWSSDNSSAFFNTKTDARGEFAVYFKDFSSFVNSGIHYHAPVDLTVKYDNTQVTKTVDAIYQEEVSICFEL